MRETIKRIFLKIRFLLKSEKTDEKSVIKEYLEKVK